MFRIRGTAASLKRCLGSVKPETERHHIHPFARINTSNQCLAGSSASSYNDNYLVRPASLSFSTSTRPKHDRNNKRQQNHSSGGGADAKKNHGSPVPAISSHDVVRLSKRMSELDICSRREADRYIMEGRVMIGDVPVEPILGQKIPANESNIVLLSQPYNHRHAKKLQSDDNHVHDKLIQRRAMEFSWQELQSTSVILHKPLGYVSGQPEEGPQGGDHQKHTPAVRLLTPSNAYIVKSNYDNSQQEYQEAKQIVSKGLKFQTHRATRHTTLRDYVPAGRLDLNSSGILIFTNNGIMAKKLISPEGLLEKEYIVLLEPVQSLTRYERQAGMTHLPLTPRDNTPRMLKGGHTLWGEHRPLRPVVDVEWLDLTEGLAQLYFPLAAESPRSIKALRLVLKEGRKHQVRRMCREMLGMHVIDLVRTRIGPIELQSIPEGKWRPLRKEEAEFIYSS